MQGIAMCGRYTQTRDIAELLKRFGVENWEEFSSPPRYNLAPSQMAPVVVMGENGRPTLKQMKWGLLPPWAKGADERTLPNLRAETLLNKPSFRRILASSRCLVPADGFYEWKKVGAKKQPCRFTLESNELFALGGVFGKMTLPNGRATETFALITTEPNATVKTVHNRMPVIVPQELESIWLKKDAPQANWLKALAPYPAAEMRGYEVSPAMNKATLDSEICIKPL